MGVAIGLCTLSAQLTCLRSLIKDGESGIPRPTPKHGQRVAIGGPTLQESKKIRGSSRGSMFDGTPPSQVQLQRLAGAEPRFEQMNAAQRGSSSAGNSPLKEGSCTSSLSPAKMHRQSIDPHIQAGSVHVIKPGVHHSCKEARTAGHGRSDRCRSEPCPLECESVKRRE